VGYVLVVENDESICELLHIVLSEEGYDVRCATTIGAALELVQEHQPSVILFDMKVSEAMVLRSSRATITCIRGQPR
jgi:DNA-binding response OmpR family regulator